MGDDEEPAPVDSEPGGSVPGGTPAPGGSHLATGKGGGEFMQSWANPDPDMAPSNPTPPRRIPRVVWRVVSVLVFLGFLAFAFLGPIRGSILCRHPGTAESLPLRIIVALIGLGIARAIWILGGTEPEPWRYAGAHGGPQPVARQGRRRTGAWWALFPWLLFLGFVAALFVFHLGDCG